MTYGRKRASGLEAADIGFGLRPIEHRRARQTRRGSALEEALQRYQLTEEEYRSWERAEMD
jgi:hypothetical protein